MYTQGAPIKLHSWTSTETVQIYHINYDKKKQSTVFNHLITNNRIMNPQQLNQKYSDLLSELFLEAARGDILTYEEFTARFRALDSDYLREAEAVGCNDTSADPLFIENAASAQTHGESLRDYAYRWLTIQNDLSLDIRTEGADHDE